MQRYFINQTADANQPFSITDHGDVHHIVNVMRYQVGDKIIITFSDKSVYECIIQSIGHDDVVLTIGDSMNIDTELPQHITICSGLIKADKYEWMLQKSTELGASAFIAVGMERSIVKLNETKLAKKVERWQKIIKEAAEQSYRLSIPGISYQASIKEVLKDTEQYDYILIAYEDAAKNGEISNFKTLVQNFKQNDRILIIFGPEGGLSEDEITLTEPCSEQIGLGPRILRAETAPLYALSAISYAHDLQTR
ncbi:16S rRNA (uracil(1498)-N(3))-methyltransferase [Staphylococcus caeli]|uniref:16S rRNA (uracil(1498)-N(3))-methyltransferase n=1 Tax=Staphylococcus caeli TaxID=2201815 RepID=UPI003F569B2E